MELPENRFKRALDEGRQQIGLWCSLPSAYAAEIVAPAPASTGCCSTPSIRRATSLTVLSQLQAVAPYDGLARRAAGEQRRGPHQALARHRRADRAHALRPVGRGGAAGRLCHALPAGGHARRVWADACDPVRAGGGLLPPRRGGTLPHGADRDAEPRSTNSRRSRLSRASMASSSVPPIWQPASATRRARTIRPCSPPSRTRSGASAPAASRRAFSAPTRLRPALHRDRHDLHGGGDRHRHSRPRGRKARAAVSRRLTAPFHFPKRMDPMPTEIQHFINGQFNSGRGGRSQPVFNPATGEQSGASRSPAGPKWTR